MVTYIIDKSDITSIKKVEIDRPLLKEGQVRFRIEKGGLTANNITYAVLGERFQYWNFFPHKVGGVLPIWGYARVIESKAAGIKPGQRYYGYYPLAEELVVQPVRVNAYGMVDGMKHRQKLPQVYNYYENVAINGVTPDIEDAYMIFQPLFATSFLLAHYFTDHDSFGAEEVYVTSASSKTAIAFAAMLLQMDEPLKIVGLTSERNVAFCQSTGLYDNVLSYDRISEISPSKSVIVDFAGNSSLLANLQKILIPQLVKCITVGLSHWDQSEIDIKLPIKSELFFAPDHAVQKQKEWGGRDFKMKLNLGLLPFLNKSDSWYRNNYKKDLMNAYHLVLNGKLDADQLMIINI